MSGNPLNDFLEGGDGALSPLHGQRPSEIVIIPFETFDLRGTRLGFGDTWQLWEGITVDCPSGPYALEAECFRYGSDSRVARVRAICPGRNAKRGNLCGEFDVDVGSACVFDFDAIEGYADHAGEAFDGWVQENVIDAERPMAGSISCAPARTSIVFFDCGFGDGSFSVFDLRDGAEIVGAEAVFMTEDEPYPFG